MGINVEKLKLG